MSTEAKVAGHYGRGQLEERILAAVAREGKDPENLTCGDLAAVDEFHVGGLEATQELAKQMELRAGLRLLDVGSGIGGPPRVLLAGKVLRGPGIDFAGRIFGVGRRVSTPAKPGEAAGDCAN